MTALSPDLMRARLDPPTGPVRLLIDTDTANEIDDQFAIAWALFRPDRLRVEAITAEPYSFRHHIPELRQAEAALRAGGTHAEYLLGGFQGWVHRLQAQGRRVDDLALVGPAEGMEQSHAEILRVCAACGTTPPVFRGADRYAAATGDIVWSPAAEAIVDLAKSGDSPLYVAAMGCVTNIAAALWRAPEIASRIVLVWTSAYPSHAPHSVRPSLNLVQDVPSSRAMFDLGVPLVYLPGYHVGVQLRISLPEMERFVAPRGAIGALLHDLYVNNPLHRMFALTDTARRSWVIWDMICIAWLLNPGWVPSFLTTAPVLTDDLHWRKDPARHAIREGHDIQRDEIFLNFYDCLPAAQAQA
jgi:inosine-uridine nucleoside N-ribohydrolase